METSGSPVNQGVYVNREYFNFLKLVLCDVEKMRVGLKIGWGRGADWVMGNSLIVNGIFK